MNCAPFLNESLLIQVTLSAGETSIAKTKGHVCIFCGKLQQKLQRHQRRQHKTEAEVAAAMSLPEGSEKQILAFEKLRHQGDYHHNCDVLALGQGELIVVRAPKEKNPDPESFLPCPHCLGFFKREELWRHRQTCPHRPNEDKKKWTKVQQEAATLLPTSFLSTKGVNKTFHDTVLSCMKNDDISNVARKDQLIVKFGSSVFDKVGSKNANDVSQRMRQLARLLILLRDGGHQEANLEDFIDTAKFDDLVSAVKKLCGFRDESNLEIGIPSLALKLGHSIKRCALVLRSCALRQKDGRSIKNCQHFIDLFEAEWSTKISSRSLASLGSKKQNKVELLPLAEDLIKLKIHLEKKIEDLSRLLEGMEESNPKYVETWQAFSKVTLARIIIFNKRRSGETATLQIEQFQTRPNWQQCSSTSKASLTALEQHLCER